MPREIERSLLAAVIEGRLPPGSKLSENTLAQVYGVSRTVIREALARLENRKIVCVKARKGWFVNTPDASEATQVFAARRAIEFGFLSTTPAFGPEQIAALRAHLDDEKRAIDEGDRGRLVYLMGDFHVRIAQMVGNEALTDIMRNLTARTILISLRFQSDRNALASHRDHCDIFDALAAGDMARAAQLSFDHLEDVEAGLETDISTDPLDALRQTLRLAPAASGTGDNNAAPNMTRGTTHAH